MKKLVLMIVLLGFTFGLYGCNSNKEEFIVGVVAISNRPDWEVQKKYLSEEVGPALNMSFIFSEVVTDTNGLLTFMENAYAQGAKGIINLFTSGIEQGTQKAQELGMYIVHIASRQPEGVLSIPYNLGSVGASTQGIYESYSTAIDHVLNDGQDHSLIIFSGAAVAQRAASHFYSTKALLEAMRDKYNLTYSQSIDDIINNSTPGPVNTGKDNIKIYIVPGTDVNAALQTASTPLQSGNYDVFAAVFSYATFTTAIDEVEKQTNKDIKIIGTTSIEPQTATGFNNKDSLGNSILNAAILNPLNIQNGVAAVILYNALTGHAEKMKQDGKSLQFFVNSWVSLNGETYEKIALLDVSKETYVLNGDDLLSYTVKNNPDVTFADLQALLVQLQDIQGVIEDKLP